jgi:hypothetical protein
MFGGGQTARSFESPGIKDFFLVAAETITLLVSYLEYFRFMLAPLGAGFKVPSKVYLQGFGGPLAL